MRLADGILGHRRQLEQLERARRAGRVAHAYLFHGPRGVGKEQVARAFAQSLNCTDAAASPCGQCQDCQLVEQEKHPDVRLLASEAELVRRGRREAESRRAPSSQIRIEQLDELQPLFRHRPYRGGWKVVIVVDAHAMNQFCQNRFLKTLEEPSPDTVIVMVTHRPDALLDTVRSRCQPLSFGTLPVAEIAGWLEEHEGLDAGQAAVLAAMGQGSLGQARQLAQGDILQLRNSLAEVVEQVPQAGLGRLLEMAGDLSGKRDDVSMKLDLLEWWCRDLLLLSGGVDPARLANRDSAQRLERLAERVPARRVLDWLAQIRRTRAGLERNANPRLMLESLLIGMHTA